MVRDSMIGSSADAEAVSGAIPYSFAYLPSGGRWAFCAYANPQFGPSFC
jgi:hypothetical protein